MTEKDDNGGRPRLLMVVNVFHPDRGGGGAIFSDLAYGLAERGIDVTVRCAYPYYPEWRDKSGANGLRIARQEDHGVHVERYGIFIPRRPNSLVQRLLYEASFLLSLLRSIRRGHDYDLVMAYCPLVGAVAFAAVNKWLHRKPLWLNVQDLSADAAAASGIARGKGLIKGLGAVQNTLFNQADLWSSISPVMVRRLEALRTGGQPIAYLPNWLNASMANALAAQPGKEGRAPGETVNLLYAGNIGAKQDLLRFCKTLHDSDAPFRFRIHGNGGHADTVRQWVGETGDARFSFGDFLDEPAWAQALNETDFFVITEKSGSGGSFIPCKMIAGLASGSPILAVSDADSPLGEEMRSADPGPWFAWDEAENAVAMLKTIAAAPERFTTWQRNATARAAFYARDNVIARFEAIVRGICESGKVAEAVVDQASGEMGGNSQD